jgi:glycosyltransferase involved in cell wall biosynthesis
LNELSDLPIISIIVPSHNEAQYIPYCLESLVKLNFPTESYEIIVVDNGSTDETAVLSQKFTNLVYICPGMNISGIRNFGVKKARGNILAFIDADCIADENWLLNAVNSLKRDVCITGSEVCIPDNALWIERAWFSQGNSGRQAASHINSANLIVPSDVFKKIGGFNETLSTGEDYEFSMRAKKIVKVISDNNIKVIHLGNPKTLRQFVKREIWHGLGALGSFKINWFDKPLIGTVLFSLITVFQIIGIFTIIIKGQYYLFIWSLIALFILLNATVLYRIKNKFNFKHWLQLLLLYYFYYFGRSISFLYILIGNKPQRHRQ